MRTEEGFEPTLAESPVVHAQVNEAVQANAWCHQLVQVHAHAKHVAGGEAPDRSRWVVILAGPEHVGEQGALDWRRERGCAAQERRGGTVAEKVTGQQVAQGADRVAAERVAHEVHGVSLIPVGPLAFPGVVASEAVVAALGSVVLAVVYAAAAQLRVDLAGAVVAAAHARHAREDDGGLRRVQADGLAPVVLAPVLVGGAQEAAHQHHGACRGRLRGLR
mmetsp:Transcript_5093/g.16360  ORF Transcript_5093/g.16360 Transcript_5093/m.16360 type:complete len:220 (+) Transcript_5093:788-1447(+)